MLLIEVLLKTQLKIDFLCNKIATILKIGYFMY